MRIIIAYSDTIWKQSAFVLNFIFNTSTSMKIDKITIFQNSKNLKTFFSWSSSLISKKQNFDSVTANSLVYKD